jgi:hypothetical protein
MKELKSKTEDYVAEQRAKRRSLTGEPDEAGA